MPPYNDFAANGNNPLNSVSQPKGALHTFPSPSLPLLLQSYPLVSHGEMIEAKVQLTGFPDHSRLLSIGYLAHSLCPTMKRNGTIHYGSRVRASVAFSVAAERRSMSARAIF
jgi:hypothetical protein